MVKKSKRNNALQKPPLPENPTIPPVPPLDSNPLRSVPSLDFLGAWTSTILFACSLFFIFKGMVRLGEVFGVAALVFQGIKMFSEKKLQWPGKTGLVNIPRVPHLPRVFKSEHAVIYLVLLWLALCTFALTFPSYGWLNPAAQNVVPFQGSFWFPLILFIGMAGMFRLMPAQETAPKDISSWAARFWLLASLGLGAYLRLYHSTEAPGRFWDDNLYYIVNARHVAEFSNYQGNFIFQQAVLPVVPYMSVFLWHLFPDLHTIPMERLTGTVFDLGTIWILYLVGKEIASRRMGVLAAALGAVSKALIQKCFTGYTDHSVVALSLALAILFTLRVVKKPDIRHFLQWGIIIGLGEYTTPQFTVFIPFLLFLILGLLYFQKSTPGQGRPGPMVWITAVVLLGYYLYYCGALSDSNYINWFIDFAGPWMPCMVLAAVLILGAIYFPKMVREPQNEKWIGWISAAWICTALSFPVLTCQVVFIRIKGNLFNAGQGVLSGDFILRFIQRLGLTYQALFWGAGDRSDMSLPVDAFMGFPEAVFIVLGLAFCLAKPNPKRIFIVLLMIMGIVPYNVAAAPHSGYLVGCITPFLLLGALGLNELLNRLFQLVPSRIFRGLVFLSLIGFWGWAAQGIFSRVYDQLGGQVFDNNSLGYSSAIRDLNEGNRVYIDRDTIMNSATAALYEGRSVHPWYKNLSDIIYLGPDESPKNIVLYSLPPASDLKAVVQKYYPSAQWTEVTPNKNYGFVLRCFIPGSAVSFVGPATAIHSKIAAPPFEFQRVAAPYWERQFSNSDDDLTFSILLWDDKTPNVNAPLPANVLPGAPIVRYEGVIQTQGGDYVITCKTSKRTQIKIDGRKIFDLSFMEWDGHETPLLNEKKTIHLKPGSHQVTVVYFLQTPSAPEITLRPKGSAGEGLSLWSSFNF
jgi:hypothetical protein